MGKNFFGKMWRHKFLTTLIIIGLGIASYFGYKSLRGSTNETRYIIGTVEKGTITTSVSGSGQVSPITQVNVSPQVSGGVTAIGVKNGQMVKAGDVIAQLDTKDAKKAIETAQIGLKTAELNLAKLQNASGKPLKDNLTTDDYVNVYNTIASAFQDLPLMIKGLDNILYSSSYLWGDDGKAFEAYGDTAIVYMKDAENKYEIARSAYDQNLISYKKLSLNSDRKNLESVLNETYNSGKKVSDAIKSCETIVNYVVDKTSSEDKTAAMTQDQNSLNSYSTKISAHLENFLTNQNTIRDLGIGLQLQNLSMELKENDLITSQEDLNKCTIVAPMDGLIAVVNSVKGDSVSTATVIATMISQKMQVKITLNEVDVAKVKIGQMVNLTFDAIENLSITGKVSEIDVLGTTTQGVVTYSVKISLDTEDERIKPSMSATAAIITDVAQNALLVPNAAIKSSNGNSYVEMLTSINLANEPSAVTTGIVSKSLPREQQVQIGLSNDTSTEVIGGLKEGDQIVIRTITAVASSSSTATQGQSLFQSGGANRGGGNVRIPGAGRPD